MPSNSQTKYNFKPLQDIGLNEDEIRGVLTFLGPLLQELILEEFGKAFTKEEAEAIEERTKGHAYESMVAYNDLYKQKTGRPISEFVDDKIDELIVVIANFISKQKVNLNILNKLDKSKLDEFKHLVDEGKTDEAQELLDMSHTN